MFIDKGSPKTVMALLRRTRHASCGSLEPSLDPIQSCNPRAHSMPQPTALHRPDDSAINRAESCVASGGCAERLRREAHRLHHFWPPISIKRTYDEISSWAMTRRVPSLAQRRKKPEPDLEHKEVDVLFGDS